jgi:protein-S-isoprenylcysteine O-methyltransferase Ste14
MTALKAILFLCLVPGLLLGYLPYRVAAADVELFAPGVLAWLAFPFWWLGGAGMLWCVWNFLFYGKGTPAPIDPPRKLVKVGLYRFVRNPMYVSAIVALLGWSLWSPSAPLLAAPFLFFTAAHLFVTGYEEPTLKKKFGAVYEEYCKLVPRWIPKLK